ncbi:LOW QUALITY PROTEIN: ribosomal protein L11 methyltransferase [Macadamia integrifolia]|uniref:LOW QUALITY PROTEIN: ribosomal protein L11 methyltransferase n=1 Tax=Macadamia integrifolia TaxID=60698 RepID=UPI001C527D8F|nr:LOW QUALITY PROTEIN: ribosomal protein L11 methyltransferase [Macadamia integrifolia]
MSLAGLFRHSLFKLKYLSSPFYHFYVSALPLPRSPLHPLLPFHHFSSTLPLGSKARGLHGLGGPMLARISTSSDSLTYGYSPSHYLSVRVRCPKDFADMLSEALLCFGASSTSIDEPDSCESIDEICINSIFVECEDVNSCISSAADSVGLKEMLHYEVIMGEKCDWIKKSQESFHPVKVTEGLWIVPEWRTPPDIQATNIILNPGLAFGTGDHPTTKLCLLLLHSLIKGGEIFLDYGTGSGILGIAALKLGAALSVGVDIDPQAISSARQNAALNGIKPKKMQLCLVPSETNFHSTNGAAGDVSHGGVIAETEKYDIVIANILLNPLLELADQIAGFTKPGAVVGISGIISEQLPQIELRYSQFLESISVTRLDGWVCLSGKKKMSIGATDDVI